VKAKVTVEYDGSGLEQAKKDLESLQGLGQGAGSGVGELNDALGELQGNLIEGQKALTPFTGAVNEMAEPFTAGETVITELNDALGEHRAAIEDTADAYKALQEPLGTVVPMLQSAPAPMALLTEHAQSLSEQVGNVGDNFAALQDMFAQPLLPPGYIEHVQELMNATSQLAQVPEQLMLPDVVEGSLQAVGPAFDQIAENMAVFQDLATTPQPMLMLQEYFRETGQDMNSFTESIGKSWSDIHEQMSQQSQDIGNSFVGMGDEAKSTSETITDLGSSIADTSKSIDEIGIASEEASKNGEGFFGGFFNSLGTQIFGGVDSAGIESKGIFGGFSDLVMGFDSFMRPLMYLQMGAQMATQLGTAIYNSAAIAEGPAAHSMGTFTESVDSLGVTAQKAGGAFSEAFGQQFTATIDGINAALGNTGPESFTGGLLGGALSFGSNLLLGGLGGLLTLTGIGAPIGLQMMFAGMAGIANNIGEWTGVGPVITGQQATPQMEIQAEVQKGLSSIPTQVISDAANAQVSATKTLIEAVNQNNLVSNAQQAYAQQFAQTQMQRYEAAHPYNYQQELLQANAANDLQNEQYAVTHNTYGNAMQQAMQQGNWFGANGFFANLGGDLFGQGGPIQGLWNLTAGNILGGLFNQGQPVSAGSVFGGIRDALSYLTPFAPAADYGQTGPGEGWASQLLGGAMGGLGSAGKFLWDITGGGIGQTFNGIGNWLGGLFGGNAQTEAIASRDVSHLSTAGFGGSLTNSGVGTQQVELSHTFTAKVDWQAENLTKSFTAAAQWAEHNLVHAAVAAAEWAEHNLVHAAVAAAEWAEHNLVHAAVAAAEWAEHNLVHAAVAAAEWAEHNLIHNAVAAAQWAEENLIHMATAVAQWAEQNLVHLATAVAQWAEQNLVHPVTAAAEWAERNLVHAATAVASWAEKNTEHLFEGIAQWEGQNLQHTFFAEASWVLGGGGGVPAFAEGVSNYSGGAAVVGEAGAEVVEHNGQYMLFDQPSFVNLPPGASVYPMQDISGYSTPRMLAQGTGETVTPILLGGAGGGNMAHSINLTVYLDSQTLIQTLGMPLAQNIRVGMGIRSY
jgi:uncharacterized coiled-coil protein SlyX